MCLISSQELAQRKRSLQETKSDRPASEWQSYAVQKGVTTLRLLRPLDLHLSSLSSFEAVGRHGSMIAAAKELGVSVAAVSRSLSRLEQKCGYTLLNNRGTGMWKRGELSLTPRGAVLHAGASVALACLEQAFTQATADAAASDEVPVNR